ncbi:hypothetical protein [Actinocatenispora comari]|uniref:Uncharacterized protein n=1 Tax=Actinocatenispora comari TaxID=2807577 RepID=A0A8J4AAP4_9ACTN|nr:hypothetical protein [Actinocatenispora comari]GIL27433.1 hypothetical protein NUM_26870 [Actinocatenispora comari]
MLRPAAMSPHEAPTLGVGVGQTIRVHAFGRIRASAIRSGRGWIVNAGGDQYEARTLDEVIASLGLLPDHHAGRQ